MTTRSETYRETLRGKCEHIRKSQQYVRLIAAESDPTRKFILEGMYRANIRDHLAHCQDRSTWRCPIDGIPWHDHDREEFAHCQDRENGGTE